MSRSCRSEIRGAYRKDGTHITPSTLYRWSLSTRAAHAPRHNLINASPRLHQKPRYVARVQTSTVWERSVGVNGDAGLSGKVYPKIELHVHLEATVAPHALLEIARRNDYPLPTDTVEGVAALYRYTDFEHFIRVWTLTSNALRRYDDFRQVVVAYAGAAKQHGAVYIEGIFAPNPRVARGGDWDEIFSGYCDGAQEARETHAVEVRLTPDITRGVSLDAAHECVRSAARYRDRGVVGVGLGGEERRYPAAPLEPAFAAARDAGLAAVPHAGEVVGPASIREALDRLGASRIRHGIRAVEDPALLRELVDRRVVLDVCPSSNLRTGAVRSLAEHPLPQLVAAGVSCSLSTDDPEMFDTDLTREYAVAISLGLSPRSFYEAGVTGALCEPETKERLRRVGDGYDWETTTAGSDR